jgi:glycosyltransferase involved in cell wall biosynthesis
VRTTPRILRYITNMQLVNGAAPTIHITEVCERLAEQGWQVHLYVPRTVRTDVAQPTIRWVSMHPVPCFRVFPSVWFQLALLARAIVTREFADTAVLYARQEQLFFAHVLLSWVFGCPLVCEFNGKLLAESEQAEPSPLGRAMLRLGIYRRIVGLGARSASLSIAVTQGIADEITSAYGVSKRLVRVINNGVNTELFKPMDRGEAQRRLGLDVGPTYLCYSGWLIAWQGLSFVIESLARLDESVHLIIVGDGPMRRDLDSLVAGLGLHDRVHFAGQVPHAVVPLYIGASHVCVNYPLQVRAGGASPFKVYEYLACGRAVVSASLPGLAEDFGSTLVFCSPESAESLGAAVMALVADRDRMASLEAGGVAFVAQAHTWRAVAREISDACLGVMESPAPTREAGH